MAFAVGGEVAIVIKATEALALEFLFREAHALVSTTNQGTRTDIQRFGTINAVYRP